jgi:hypothetical protein
MYKGRNEIREDSTLRQQNADIRSALLYRQLSQLSDTEGVHGIAKESFSVSYNHNLCT